MQKPIDKLKMASNKQKEADSGESQTGGDQLENYDTKFKEMQKYIPFLEMMIQKLERSSDKSREAQLMKMKSLHQILSNTKKKLKIETLKRCEDVLQKLHDKVEKGAASQLRAAKTNPEKKNEKKKPETVTTVNSKPEAYSKDTVNDQHCVTSSTDDSSVVTNTSKMPSAVRTNSKNVSSTTLSPAHSSEDSRDEAPSTTSTSSMDSSHTKRADSLEQSRERLKKYLGKHLNLSPEKSVKRSEELISPSTDWQYQQEPPWERRSATPSVDPRIRDPRRVDLRLPLKDYSDSWDIEERPFSHSGKYDNSYVGWSEHKEPSSRSMWPPESDRNFNNTANFGSHAVKPLISPTSQSSIPPGLHSPTGHAYGARPNNTSPIKKSLPNPPPLCNVLQHPPVAGSKPLSDADIEELLEDTSKKKFDKEPGKKGEPAHKALRAKLEQEIQQVHRVGVSKGGALRNLVQKDDKHKSPTKGKFELAKPNAEVQKDKSSTLTDKQQVNNKDANEGSNSSHIASKINDSTGTESGKNTLGKLDVKDTKPTDPRKRVPYSPRGEDNCRSVNWDDKSPIIQRGKIEQHMKSPDSSVDSFVSVSSVSNQEKPIAAAKKDGSSILSSLSKEELQKIVQENLRDLPSPPKEILETVGMNSPTVAKPLWQSSDLHSPMAAKEYNHGLPRNIPTFNANFSVPKVPLLPSPDIPQQDPRTLLRNSNLDPRFASKDSQVQGILTPTINDPRLNSRLSAHDSNYRYSPNDQFMRPLYDQNSLYSNTSSHAKQQWVGTPCYGVLSGSQRGVDGYMLPGDNYVHHGGHPVYQGISHKGQHEFSQFQGQNRPGNQATWPSQPAMRAGPSGNFHPVHHVDHAHGLNKGPVDPRLSNSSGVVGSRLSNSSNASNPRLSSSSQMSPQYGSQRAAPNTNPAVAVPPARSLTGPLIRTPSIEGRSASERDPRRRSIEETERAVRDKRDTKDPRDTRRNSGPRNSNPGRMTDRRERMRDSNSNSNPKRYESSYNTRKPISQEDNKGKETELVSPLNSLYGVAIVPKTGKGYGFQKFRIPKLKRPSPPKSPPPPPSKPTSQPSQESESLSTNTDDNPASVAEDLVVDSKNVTKVSHEDEIASADSLSAKSENATIGDKDGENNSEGGSKEAVTQEWIEALIRKSFESGEGKKFFEKAKLLERLGENLKGKKLKKIKQILESDSESQSEEEFSESVKKNIQKEDKLDTGEKSAEEDDMPVEHSKKSRCRRVIESDEEDTDDESLASKLKKREMSKKSKKLSEKSNKESIKNDESCREDETFVEQNEEDLDLQKGSEPVRKYAKRRSALELLQEDIREMFICEGVVTATGHRMCRLLKETRPGMTADEIAKTASQTVDGEVSTADESDESSLSKKLSKKSAKDVGPSKKGKESKQEKKQKAKFKLKDDHAECVLERIVEDTHDGEGKISIKIRRKYESKLEETGYSSSSPVTKPRKKCGKSKWKGYVIEDSEDSQDEANTNKDETTRKESHLEIPETNYRKGRAKLNFGSEADETENSITSSERGKRTRFPRVILEKADISKLTVDSAEQGKKYYDTSSDESAAGSTSSLVNFVKVLPVQKSNQKKGRRRRGRGGRVKKCRKKRTKGERGGEISTDVDSIISDYSSVVSMLPQQAYLDDYLVGKVFLFRRKFVRKKSQLLGKKIGDVLEKLVRAVESKASPTGTSITEAVCAKEDKGKSEVKGQTKSSALPKKKGRALVSLVRNSGIHKRPSKKIPKWQLGIVSQSRKKGTQKTKQQLQTKVESNEMDVTKEMKDVLSSTTDFVDKDGIERFENSIKLPENSNVVQCNEGISDKEINNKEDENNLLKDESIEEKTASKTLEPKCNVEEEKGEGLNSANLIEKDYFLDGRGAKYTCKLCPAQCKNIVSHYKSTHPSSEVLISRLSYQEATRAAAETFGSSFDGDDSVFLTTSTNMMKKGKNQARQFICRMCDHAAALSMAFFEHVSSHTGEYRFKCSECSYTSGTRKALKNHFYGQHPDLSGIMGMTPVILYVGPPKDAKIVPGYLCSSCNFVQLIKENTEKHIARNHASEEDAKIIEISMSKPLPSVKRNTENLVSSTVKDVEESNNIALKSDAKCNKGKEVIESTPMEIGDDGNITLSDKAKNSLKTGEESNCSTVLSEDKDKDGKQNKTNTLQMEVDHEVPVENRTKISEKTAAGSNEESSITAEGDKEQSRKSVEQKEKEVHNQKKDNENSDDIDNNDLEQENDSGKVSGIEVETTTEKQTIVEQPPKEIDLKAFVCSEDLEKENSVIQKERLKKMEEIAKDLKHTLPELLQPNRSSIIDKLSNKLKSVVDKPNVDQLKENKDPSTDKNKIQNVQDTSTIIDEKRAIEAAQAVQNLLRAEKESRVESSHVTFEEVGGKNAKHVNKTQSGDPKRRITRSVSRSEEQDDDDTDDESSSDISFDFDDDNDETPESETQSPDITMDETLSVLKEVSPRKSSNIMFNDIIERLALKIVSKTEPIDVPNQVDEVRAESGQIASLSNATEYNSFPDESSVSKVTEDNTASNTSVSKVTESNIAANASVSVVTKDNSAANSLVSVVTEDNTAANTSVSKMTEDNIDASVSVCIVTENNTAVNSLVSIETEDNTVSIVAEDIIAANASGSILTEDNTAVNSLVSLEAEDNTVANASVSIVAEDNTAVNSIVSIETEENTVSSASVSKVTEGNKATNDKDDADISLNVVADSPPCFFSDSMGKGVAREGSAPIRVGPLEVKRFSEGLLYSCCVRGCIFASTNRMLFAMHIENTHKLSRWDGICITCKDPPYIGPLGVYKLSHALHHLITYHLVASPNDALASASKHDNETKAGSEIEVQSVAVNKTTGMIITEPVSEKTSKEGQEKSGSAEGTAEPPRIRLRRLSGDLLSVSKPIEDADSLQDQIDTEISENLKEGCSANEDDDAPFLRIESVVSLNPEAMATDDVHDILKAVEAPNTSKSPEKSDSMDSSSEDAVAGSSKSIFRILSSKSNAKIVDSHVPIMTSSPITSQSVLKSSQSDMQLYTSSGMPITVVRGKPKSHGQMKMIPISPLPKSSYTIVPYSPVKLSNVQLSPVKLKALKNIDVVGNPGMSTNIPRSLVSLSNVTSPMISKGMAVSKDKLASGVWQTQVLPPILPKRAYVRVEIKDNKVSTKEVKVASKTAYVDIMSLQASAAGARPFAVATRALPSLPMTTDTVSSMTQVPISSPVETQAEVTASEQSSDKPTPSSVPSKGPRTKNIVPTPPSTPASSTVLQTTVPKSKIPHKSAVAPSYAKASKVPAVYHEMVKPAKLRHLYKCMARFCSFTTDIEANYAIHYYEHENKLGLKAIEKKRGRPAATLKLSEWQQCAYCCVMHTSLESIVDHVKREHGHCLFQCAYCFYRAISKSYIILHQNTSHINEHVAVLLCKEIPKLPPPENQENAREDVILPYVCEQGACGKFYITDKFLRHLEKEHMQLTTYSCHICGNKSFKPDRLIAHYKLHSCCFYQCMYCLHGTDTREEMHHHYCNFHSNQKGLVFIRETDNKDEEDNVEFLKILDLDENTSEEYILILPPPELEPAPEDPSILNSLEKNCSSDVDGIVSLEDESRSRPRSERLSSNDEIVSAVSAISEDTRGTVSEVLNERVRDESTKSDAGHVNSETTANAKNKNIEDIVIIDDDDDDDDDQSDSSQQESSQSELDSSISNITEEKSESDSQKNKKTPGKSLASNLNADKQCVKKIVSKLNESTDSDVILLDSTAESSREPEMVKQKRRSGDSLETNATQKLSEPSIPPKQGVPKPAAEISPYSMEHGQILKEPLVTLKHRNPKTTAAIEAAVDPLKLDEPTNEPMASESMEPKEVPKEDAASATAADSAAVEDEDIEGTGLSGSNLYKCGYDTCTFSAEESSKLKEHLFVCDCARVSSTLTCPHCTKQIKHSPSFLEHLRTHGTLRFGCGLCSFRAPVPQQMTKHLKQRHKVNNSRIVPLNPNKNNPETAVFVVFPKDKGKGRGGKGAGKDSHDSRRKIIYMPEEIESLPRQAIFARPLRCATCSYTTKVRSNMIRHLQLHLETNVPDEVPPPKAPVNPVPCLENKEMMFDKMTNLAASSYIAVNAKAETLASNVLLTEEMEAKLPKFIPEHQRYVCGAPGCTYLTCDETMLRYHLRALHFDETAYRCPHCNETASLEGGQVSIEKMGAHLKMHDNRLYRCAHCMYYHFQRHFVERHLADKHPEKRPFVHVVREPEVDPNAKTDAVASTSAETGTSATPGAVKNQWQCGLCEYECSTRSEVLDHCWSTHGLKSQFKCGLCNYRSSSRPSFDSHFASKHPTSDSVELIHVYRKVDVPLTPLSPSPTKAGGVIQDIDTMPLWRRDVQRIRHIRGILLEEEGDAPKPDILHRPSTEGADVEEADESPEEPGGKYGPYGKPIGGIYYFCTLCNKYRSKFKADFRDHLYRELKYHKWVCTHCRLMSCSKSALQKHSQAKHDKGRKPEAIAPLTPNKDIEEWVDQVIATQLLYMKTEQQQSGVPNTASTSQPGASGLSAKTAKSAKQDPSKAGPSSKRTSVANPSQNISEDVIVISSTSSDSESGTSKNMAATKVENNPGISGTSSYGKDTAKVLKYSCKHCIMKFALIRGLKLHIRHNHLRNSVWTCKYCGFVGKSQEAVHSHNNEKHPDLPLKTSVHTKGSLIKLDDEFWEREYGLGTDTTPLLSVNSSPSSSPLKRRLRTSSQENDDASSTTSSMLDNAEEALNKCPHCNYCCRSASDLKYHMMRHWAQKPFKCGYCAFEGVREYEIKKHSAKIHPLLKLRVIEKPVPSQPEIRPLQRTKRSRVEVDGTSFDAVPEKVTRLDESSDDVEWVDSKNEKSDAETTVASELPKIFRCFYCPQRGSSLVDIHEHWQEKHKNKLIGPNGVIRVGLPFKYKEVNMKQFLTGKDMGPGRKPALQCAYCKFRGNLKSLEEHQRLEHPDKPLRDNQACFARYECAECHFTAFTVNTLKRHFEAEHEGKELQYLVKYTKEDVLAVEEKKSTLAAATVLSQRPTATEKYVCLWCDEMFESEEKIQVHHALLHLHLKLKYSVEKSNTVAPALTANIKRFGCPVCTFSSENRQLVYEHLYHHAKPYRCGYCNKTFEVPAKVRNHIFVSHPDNEFRMVHLEDVERELAKWRGEIVIRDGSSVTTMQASSKREFVKFDYMTNSPKKLCVARKSTSLPPRAKFHAVARKSTNPLPRQTASTSYSEPSASSSRSVSPISFPSSRSISPVSFPEFSFYGCSPSPVDKNRITATVKLRSNLGVSMNMSLATMERFTNMQPVVRVKDLKYEITSL